MSLSSLLLPSKKKKIDTELDALFTSKPAIKQLPPVAESNVAAESSSSVVKKRKHTEDSADSLKSSPKRSKSSKKTTDPPADSSETVEPSSERKSKKKKDRKGKAKAVEEEESEDENPDLEETYAQSRITKADADENASQDAESELDETALVHESVKPKKDRGRSKAGVKFVPADETPAQRDARTVFIGNLSLEVAQKKPLLKQLHRHILSHIPTAKIESTRFRSIPFKAPTSQLPEEDEDDTSKTPSKKPKAAAETKEARPHDKERISSWRSQKASDDTGKADEKRFLTPQEKKKIAFINQEFHATADTVNAYIVFAHPAPSVNRAANLPPLPPTLDPYEAARLAREKCDGTTFMERMIRVDLVAKKGLPGLEDGDVEGALAAAVEGDPKLCVFVGNLDFASKEEDLRVFFEGVVSGERGPPVQEEDDSDDEGGEKKNGARTWVARVRIVRDRETQLGKGFAYVQFADRQCVDEILAMEDTKLRFAKRKLRVQRCKTLPGGKLPVPSYASKSKSAAPNKAQPVHVPKGDPLLGDKLVHLSKDERKKVKSTDADRVARRLAKKKARMVLGNEGVKVQGKERERVRKTGALNKGGAVKKDSSKGRVRSERSVARKNTKKQ